MTLYADKALAEKLQSLGDELRFVLLTSQAHVADIATAPADAQESELKGLKLLSVKRRVKNALVAGIMQVISVLRASNQKFVVAVSLT